jgi:hypothetical protein
MGALEKFEGHTGRHVLDHLEAAYRIKVLQISSRS